MSSWLPLPANTGFGPDTLPYGVVGNRVVVPIGDRLLDLATALARLDGTLARLVDRPTLDPLLAAGRPTWDAVRATVHRLVTVDTPEHRRAVEAALRDPGPAPQLPFTVADYVDFYSSEQHATNVGRIVRPDAPALPPAWKHLPIGYHGRSGTVVVSGTPVRRPRGILGPGRYGPSERLDIEAEVGFVVGTPSPLGAAGARGRLARARLRRRAGQRLERPGHPVVRDPPARAVPRQVVPHVGLALGGAARGAGAGVRRPAGAGPAPTGPPASRPARRWTWPWRCG